MEQGRLQGLSPELALLFLLWLLLAAFILSDAQLAPQPYLLALLLVLLVTLGLLAVPRPPPGPGENN